MRTVTFLDLQRHIQQTRKARKGVKNKRDYFADTTFDEEMVWHKIYQRALKAANEVIKHYTEIGEFNPEEKMNVFFGEKSKSDKINKNLEKENQKLQAEIIELKKQLEKFHRGGRKSYDDAMIQQVKSARANGETWRGLAKRLCISTTTAQKLQKVKL